MKIDNSVIYFILLVQEVFKEPYRLEFDDETKRINKLKEIAEFAKRESEIKTLNKLMEKYKEEINFNNKESK